MSEFLTFMEKSYLIDRPITPPVPLVQVHRVGAPQDKRWVRASDKFLCGTLVWDSLEYSSDGLPGVVPMTRGELEEWA